MLKFRRNGGKVVWMPLSPAAGAIEQTRRRTRRGSPPAEPAPDYGWTGTPHPWRHVVSSDKADQAIDILDQT